MHVTIPTLGFGGLMSAFIVGQLPSPELITATSKVPLELCGYLLAVVSLYFAFRQAENMRKTIDDLAKAMRDQNANHAKTNELLAGRPCFYTPTKPAR